ncbi:MAG: hypothetical protein ABH823_03875 [bacterium]
MSITARIAGWAKTRFTFAVTERSFQKHTPTMVSYQLLQAGQTEVKQLQTQEYLPDEQRVTVPEINLGSLPLDDKAPVKVLIFVPTYDSQEYIGNRLRAIEDQCANFPENWQYEIMMVVNGRGQAGLWQHLQGLRTSMGLEDKLTLTYIPKEENLGMVQSKITPLNITTQYARDKGFNVISCVDDDVTLSDNNFVISIGRLIQETRERQAPVLIGPETRYAQPRTRFDRVLVTGRKKTKYLKIRGCNIFLWADAFPLIPVDGGNEDFVLNFAFGNNTIGISEAHNQYRLASTFWAYISQFNRYKWNDFLGTRYVADHPLFGNQFVEQLRLLRPDQRWLSRQGLANLFIGAINLQAFVQVKASVLARNIYNVPRSTVDWVGTVDQSSKDIGEERNT